MGYSKIHSIKKLNNFIVVFITLLKSKIRIEQSYKKMRIQNTKFTYAPIYFLFTFLSLDQQKKSLYLIYNSVGVKKTPWLYNLQILQTDICEKIQ